MLANIGFVRLNKLIAYNYVLSAFLHEFIAYFFQPSDGDATLSLSPPFKSSDFSINFVGGDLELQTAFGLTIACGSSGSVRISLPPDYAGQVEGLCGDFDGDKNNDGNITLFDPGNFVSKQYFVPDVENPSDV